MNSKVLCNFIVLMQKHKFLTKIISSVIVASAQFSTSTATKEVNPLNSKLISNLVTNGVIRSPEVENVMKSIDRGDFSHYDPYYDR